MKSYHQKFISNHPYESVPMAEISGFPVRPGIYDLNGATPLQKRSEFYYPYLRRNLLRTASVPPRTGRAFCCHSIPGCLQDWRCLFHDRFMDLTSKNLSTHIVWMVLIVRKKGFSSTKTYPSGSLCKSCRRTAYVGNPLGSQLSCTSCPRPF